MALGVINICGGGGKLTRGNGIFPLMEGSVLFGLLIVSIGSVVTAVEC